MALLMSSSYVYAVGLLLGPILSGSFQEHVGWRWFFWFCTILQGVIFVVLLFLAPETRRAPVDLAACALSDGSAATTVESAPEQGQAFESSISDKDEGHAQVTHTNVAAANSIVGTGRPAFRHFLPYQKVDRRAVREIWRHILTPFQIFFFPICFWAQLSQTLASQMLLSVALVQSQALAAPPYLWSAQSVGFSNFAFLGGMIIGMTAGTPFSDWWVNRCIKRNQYVREAEMRLPTLIPFLLAQTVGMLVSRFRSPTHCFGKAVRGRVISGLTFTPVAAHRIWVPEWLEVGDTRHPGLRSLWGVHVHDPRHHHNGES